MVDSLSLQATNQAGDNSLDDIAHNPKLPTVSVSETDSSTSNRQQQNDNIPADDTKAASQKDYQLFEDQDKMI